MTLCKHGKTALLLNLNCGERYEDTIDHRSYVHSFGSCKSSGFNFTAAEVVLRWLLMGSHIFPLSQCFSFCVPVEEASSHVLPPSPLLLTQTPQHRVTWNTANWDGQIPVCKLYQEWKQGVNVWNKNSHLTFYGIHTTQEEFEEAALFLRLGLPFTLIHHENRAFRKRSVNRRHLKTQRYFYG